MKTPQLIAIIVLAVIAIALLAFIPPRAPQAPNDQTAGGKLDGNPTDFSYEGRLSFAEGSVLMFAFVPQEGAEGIVAPLSFDALSMCAFANAAVPCLSLDVSQDLPFDGRVAVVEGRALESGVLVRKLTVVAEGQQALIPAPGSIFVSYDQAKEFILSCAPSSITQTNLLDIVIRFADGTTLRAVEPQIDDILPTIAQAVEACGSVPFATE